MTVRQPGRCTCECHKGPGRVKHARACCCRHGFKRGFCPTCQAERTKTTVAEHEHRILRNETSPRTPSAASEAREDEHGE